MFCVHMCYKYLLPSGKNSFISIICSQYVFVNTLFCPFPWSVVLHLYPMVVIQVLWLIARPAHSLFRGFSLQSVSFSHLNTLPAPLPFSQLLLSHLLVRVLMSNQVQLFFPFVVISVSCSYSSLSLWLLAVCCHFQQILCPTFYFFLTPTLWIITLCFSPSNYKWSRRTQKGQGPRAILYLQRTWWRAFSKALQSFLLLVASCPVVCYG